VSVRVNLLPREAEQRNQQRRMTAVVGAGVLALAVVLGVLYFLRTQSLDDANQRLADEQASLQALQAQVQELREFGELEDQLEALNTLIAGAMGGEASLAGVLQDLAAIMPSNAEISTLSVSVADATGTLTTAGRVIGGHAPGVERFLLEIDKVASFLDPWISASAVDLVTNIASFSLQVQLGPEILTHRYDGGIPEVLR